MYKTFIKNQPTPALLSRAGGCAAPLAGAALGRKALPCFPCDLGIRISEAAKFGNLPQRSARGPMPTDGTRQSFANISYKGE